jgi:hypothetical protein
VLPQTTDLIDTAPATAHRPRLSRETRRLLLTAFVAVLILWTLARVRFPDRPALVSPVPPILDQLTGPPTFAELAARVAELRVQLSDAIVPIALVADRPIIDAGGFPERAAALRVRDDLVVAVVTPALRRAGLSPSGIVGEDRGSGLTLIGIPTSGRPALPILWSPRNLDQPRYVLATTISPRGISLQPAFVGSLAAIDVPYWPGPVWALPMDVTLSAGALTFTEQGELIGVVASHERGLAIVPARLLLAAAEQTLEAPQKPAADLGIDVGELTPRLAVAAGAQTGVIVTWVDPSGITASLLRPGDVIQALNETAIATPEQWRVGAARTGVGDVLTVTFTRRGAQARTQIVAAPTTKTTTGVLGLTMLRIAGVGAEVIRVTRGSAADDAGLATGDVITTIDTFAAPTPAQVQSAFASIAHGELLMVAVDRGTTHRIMALQR